MVTAARDAGVLLGTAYDQRWHPAHVRLREMVPELGTVTAVRIVYCCWLPADWSPAGRPHDNWRVARAPAGGGAAIGLAPHGLALAGVPVGEDDVRLREMVPEMGTVTAVRIVYCCWLPADWSPDGRPHDNWRVDRARAGGGAAIDLAPHGLDLAGVLLGEDVVELRALLQRRVQDYPVDDGALLSGRTAGGVLVDLHVAFNTPDALPRRRLEVVGTRGMAVAVDTMGQTAGGSLTLHRPDPVDVPFAGDPPFAAQFAAFTAAVAGHAPWPYDAGRDLALHRLLLTALGDAR